VSRALAVLAILCFAVHVSVPGIPAPVPVFLALGAVIGVLVWLIFEATVRSQPHWRAGT